MCAACDAREGKEKLNNVINYNVAFQIPIPKTTFLVPFHRDKGERASPLCASHEGLCVVLT